MRSRKLGARLTFLSHNLLRLTKYSGEFSKKLREKDGSRMILSRLTSWQASRAAESGSRVNAILANTDVPLISFLVSTLNINGRSLRELVSSYTTQEASYSELILIADHSLDRATQKTVKTIAKRPGVRLVHLLGSRSVSAITNAGIASARGRWIALIDCHDVLAAGAISNISEAILSNPDAMFFYTDELVVDAKLNPIEERFKPSFDPILLSGFNYIGHLAVFRTDILAEIRMRDDFEGAQEYDLLLRYIAEISIGSIIHIPYIAYLRRAGSASRAIIDPCLVIDNARKALALSFAHNGSPVVVEAALDPKFHRVRLPGPTPLVSIVIPNRDSFPLIRRIIADLFYKTDYLRKEIVIVDNGTIDHAVLALYEDLRRNGVIIDILPEPFNFAAMCNRGARLAKGDAILFLNNDIEVRAENPDWLAEMVECLRFEATAIVGAKLDYPTGKAQHNGVIVGLGEAAGHWCMELPPEEPGPMGRLFVRQTMGAVTGACFLIARNCFEALGGFDQQRFAIAYNDVDLCVRAREAGFRTIWTPFARLIHHESASRGSDKEGARHVRFKQEMARLQERHGTRAILDDAFSPFYDSRYSSPTVVVPKTMPVPRVSRLRQR